MTFLLPTIVLRTLTSYLYFPPIATRLPQTFAVLVSDIAPLLSIPLLPETPSETGFATAGLYVPRPLQGLSEGSIDGPTTTIVTTAKRRSSEHLWRRDYGPRENRLAISTPNARSMVLHSMTAIV